MDSGSQERGQSLVGFALGAILLFTLLFGIIEFGRLIYAYSVVANAAREGARYAAVNPTANEATVEAIAQNFAVGVPIELQLGPITSGSIYAVVTVTHQFEPITPFAPSLPLRSTAQQYLEMRVVGG